MSRLLLFFLELGGTLALAAAALPAPAAVAGDTVGRVIDGDTIALADGRRVRLVQIDATELGSGECYSRKAASVLRSLIPAGTPVRLESDARLDAEDRYGRLLRYVHRRGLNVNLEMVRRGAATVWYYGRVRGRYASQLLAAARVARNERRGIWGSCRVVWNPTGPATTSGGGSASAALGGGAAGGCHPSYRPCLPLRSDLDCRDIDDSKKPIRVIGDDPYHLDGEGDGWGCE